MRKRLAVMASITFLDRSVIAVILMVKAQSRPQTEIFKLAIQNQLREYKILASKDVVVRKSNA